MPRDRQIGEVVIECKDRLVRLGSRYIEQYLAAFDVTIDIANREEPNSPVGTGRRHAGDIGKLLSLAVWPAFQEVPPKVKEAIAECSIPSAVNSST
jgi:hypothetical protein